MDAAARGGDRKAMRLTKIKIVEAREAAASGVDYSPRLGAICPWCGKRAKIYKTLPWEDRVRVRYHRCENVACVVGALRLTIKSIEVDTVEISDGVV